ncbi:MAG: PEP-CTERM sorting domain-containing protein [Kiloniellaceae bacterium]
MAGAKRILANLLFAVIAPTVAVSNTANAVLLHFSFTDPVGDQEGSIDLISSVVTFDNATGDYAIVVTADPNNPFLGDFRLNFNLFNPDVGTTNPFPSFFQDVLNDFSLSAPQTVISLTGRNIRLIAWQAGDRVAATGPNPLGLPDILGLGGFFSGVIPLPIGTTTELDNIAIRDRPFPPIILGFATITAVPEPATVTVFAIGLFGLWLIGHRRRNSGVARQSMR